MLVLLLLVLIFVPAFLSKKNSDFDHKNLKVEQAILPLLVIAAAAVSLAVGIYTFLQMRKMQKKNRPKPNQIDGTIADEGVSFCDIAGGPHVHPNITDLWNKKSEAIKQKSGGFLGIGKTSQVTGYRYYTSFAVFIGNRIEKFIAINFDNRGWIVHDPLLHPPNLLPVDKPSLFGQDAGGVVGNIDIEFGYPQPQQNPAYKQHFDLVSAYPYQSYLVFRGDTIDQPFYFGNSNYMKEMLLWVKRTRVRNDGRGQWYEFRDDGAVVCEIGTFEVIPTVGEKVANIPAFNYTFANISGEGVYTESQGIYSNMGSSAYGGVENPSISETLYAIPTAQELSLFDLVEITATITGSVRNIEHTLHNISKVYKYSVSATGGEHEEKYIVISIVCKKSEGFPYLKVVGTGTIPQGSGANIFSFNFSSQAKPLDLYNFENIESENVDINPIHKIHEILTDDTAMGKPESDVNDANFIKAADRIYDEGLGISWAIDEKSCIDAIEELCYHIEAGVRVNRQTGLYEMVLFRDDWFAENEIHSIAENKIKDLSLEVMNSDDIVNQLNVTYYDRGRIKNSTF